MIPKTPVPGLIGDGNRFSDKIMRKQSLSPPPGNNYPDACGESFIGGVEDEVGM
jgi:hypothetical protein